MESGHSPYLLWLPGGNRLRKEAALMLVPLKAPWDHQQVGRAKSALAEPSQILAWRQQSPSAGASAMDTAAPGGGGLEEALCGQGQTGPGGRQTAPLARPDTVEGSGRFFGLTQVHRTLNLRLL